MKASNTHFVRNAWYVAGWSTDFSNTIPQRRSIIGEPLAMYRRSDGTLVALADRCIHRQAPLSMGRIEGSHIRCMYHGLCFDAEGRCVEIPGQNRIPTNACVRSYPVVDKGSWAWVWMGDTALADPQWIPPVCGFDDPAWVLKSGELDYDAPYNLINDNLLDLSHLAFVHANSFGATSGWSSNPPQTHLLERGVQVDRWIEGAPPVPPLPFLARYDSVDLWVTYQFLVPGVFIMYTAMYPAGTAVECYSRAPNAERKKLFSNFTSQAATPLNEAQSRTFFTWGPGAEFNSAEVPAEAIAQMMIDVALTAFEEDKAIIEAQWHNLKIDCSLANMQTAADKSISLFQRIMDRLRKSEEVGSVETDNGKENVEFHP